jgi:sec-independent protein translocase protein TatB
MDIFGVGPIELFLFVIIAAVLFGPERFPRVAVEVAKALKFLRRYATEATSDLREEFAELTREYESMRAELNEVRSGVFQHMASVTDELTRASGEVHKAVGEARPSLMTPDLKQLLSGAPIIEPGGELPPDRKGSSNGNGAGPKR